MSVRMLCFPVVGLLLISACEGSVNKTTYERMNNNCDSYDASMEVDLSGDLPVFTLTGTAWAEALRDGDKWRNLYIGFETEQGLEPWGGTTWPTPPVETITWGDAPAGWDAWAVEPPESGTEYTVHVATASVENGGVYRRCFLGEATFTVP